MKILRLFSQVFSSQSLPAAPGLGIESCLIRQKLLAIENPTFWDAKMVKKWPKMDFRPGDLDAHRARLTDPSIPVNSTKSSTPPSSISIWGEFRLAQARNLPLNEENASAVNKSKFTQLGTSRLQEAVDVGEDNATSMLKQRDAADLRALCEGCSYNYGRKLRTVHMPGYNKDRLKAVQLEAAPWRFCLACLVVAEFLDQVDMLEDVY